MTHEMFFGIAGLEHLPKQPPGKRYALFCQGMMNDYTLECDSRRTLGHLGDFATFAEARETGIGHLHPVYVRFFPDGFDSQPSADFIETLKSAPDHVIE